jgi:hypothetical protein
MDESVFVVVVVVVVFVLLESIFMPVSAAGAAAAGAAAAGAASSFLSPEQAATSTTAATTKAIFFMAESPCEYWIGTIETAPYTQSSDSATKVRVLREGVKPEESSVLPQLAAGIPPLQFTTEISVPSGELKRRDVSDGLGEYRSC